MDETRRLAAFLSELNFDDLPEEVIETAKLCILDTTGVALAARNWPWTRMVEETVAESGGAEESTVWGSTLRCPAQQSALANGTAAHGIEMDDRCPRASVHPGAYVVPSALAVAERGRLDGRRLLTSVVAGYEFGMRLGFAVHFLRPGLHRSGHKGVWLAVAAAGHAIGLNPAQMRNALGIAGSMTSGISEFSQDPDGNMVKRLHAGFAAHNGVFAALLAHKGFTGPATVLEGQFGYITTFGADGHQPKLDELTRDLGTTFRMLEREIKPYAAWGGSHTAIDAVTELIRQRAVTPSEIKRLRIGGSSRMINEHHDRPDPKSTMAAQYSLPFVAALALHRGPEAFMDPEGLWTAETLNDPDVSALAKEAELVVDPELEQLSIDSEHYGGVRLTVTLADGSEREAVVHHSKGTLQNPATREDLQEKFRRLGRRALPDHQIDEIVSTIDDLQEPGQASRLAHLLSHAPEVTGGP